MTEKELYSFCKNEYNRLKKENKNVSNIRSDIEKKDGRDASDKYFGKSNPTIKLRFFRDCCKIFAGINKNKQSIDSSTWAKNEKKVFLEKLEKIVKNYKEDIDYDKFKKLVSSFGYKDNPAHQDIHGYQLIFNDKEFINNIDNIATNKLKSENNMYYYYTSAKDMIHEYLHGEKKDQIKESYYFQY